MVTGSAGLIGSEAALHFGRRGMHVVGLDNDMRREFFGPDASTAWKVADLRRRLKKGYEHHNLDVRNRPGVLALFDRYRDSISLVIHAAAQPSHDWAARQPFTDFDVNAVGTLNLLEASRHHCPRATFVFLSTNKVYGDRPNLLPLVELETRYQIEPAHPFSDGITEDMALDQCLHSLFGSSKLAADILVQEYGRYFEMRTACFRGGTLTGSQHAATELHGFLAYLTRCAMTQTTYTVFGYKGKQVRDAIHSRDLVTAIDRFAAEPRVGEVYNLGGGAASNTSVREAIDTCQRIVGNDVRWRYVDQSRVGDHIWWVGSNRKFESHFPGWSVSYDIDRIVTEIYEANVGRWVA